MTIKLKVVKKLVKKADGWKAYALYIGEAVKSVELLKDDTTYYIESVADLDGVAERMPGSIEQAIRALFSK